MWPDVLEVVKGLRRFTWTLLSHNAQVAALDNGRLTLAMVNAGARDSFAGGGSDEIVREALIQVLGCRLEGRGDRRPVGVSVTGSVPAGTWPAERAARRAGRRSGEHGRRSGLTHRPCRDRRRPGRRGPACRGRKQRDAAASTDAEPSPDDPDADDGEVTHQDLLARELGARVIGEYDNS